MTYPVDVAILDALNEPLSTQSIAERIGESYRVTRQRLLYLADAGIVRKDGDLWCRTNDGAAYV